ncbi:MAG TPA: SpoIIE family protein phosphatase [Thermoanaerobaculia bacterium]|nr:SpoIIE family protein phosphatase [Thermoanaerobaculia bacterium]
MTNRTPLSEVKLRTQLVLAFLVLAILPLSGIVLYAQLSSERAYRRVVEEEALQLAGEIERNIAEARQDLRRGWSRLESAPSLDSWQAEWEDSVAFGKAIESALMAMGEDVELVRSIEVVPTLPDVAEAPQAEASGAAEPPPRWESEATGKPPPAPLPELPRVRVHPGHPEPGDAPRVFTWERGRPLSIDLQAEQIGAASERLAERLMKLRGQLEAQRALAERARAERDRIGEGEAVDLHEALDVTVAAEALEVEVRRLEARSQQLEKVLGEDFSTVVAGGLGRLEADIDLRQFFRRVLSRTRREKGEVPFALGPTRELYVISDEDREQLAQVADGDLDRLEAVIAESGEVSERGGWIMATRRDPETEMVFGIARPIRESLAEMQRATGRNFLLGLGMISLALIGVLPLSARLTRGLKRLTTEADRIASGDLAARAHVGGRDELGLLAGAFNRMASQLEENQGRLLDQERREREQEMRRLLLESENARRGEELEAARRFQLSMLPDRLPEHPRFEVAVLMKTATEVGGDYYDFFSAENGAAGEGSALTVAIGDATGHGARAGTMVTVIKTLFASRVHESRPDGFLTAAHRSIRSMALDRMTMALLVARFEGSGVEVASAGMPPPLVFRLERDGSGARVEDRVEDRVEEVPTAGLPLGAMEAAEYAATRFELAPGESVLLMSDGFAELPDALGEPIGYAAVRDLFGTIGHRGADDVMLELTSALEAITGGRAPTDDVTFVVVRRCS